MTFKTRYRHRGSTWNGPWSGPAEFAMGRLGRHFGRGGWGPRARRGDARAAALLLLAEQPRNGYQLMQEIERRSEGAWRPSPGSMYPILQQLSDEGLIEPNGEGGKSYALTPEGKEYVEANAEELGTPWDAFKENAADGDLPNLLKQHVMAIVQVMRAGNSRQVKEACDLLNETRKKLYQILAEDEG